MLKLEAVTKKFGPRTVLNAVSLELGAGEIVAVLGESGVGKSTLLNVVAGLEAADSGRVLFRGADVTAMDDDAQTRLRREHFGFVFQAFHVLPHLTVQQNVSLPLVLRKISEEKTAAKARQAIASVGLAGREGSMPRELSGGELQRVAIARALVGDPALVLADEPTGNLDPQNAGQVLGLLVELVKGKGSACVLATHSLESAQLADRRFRLTSEGLAPL